MKNELKKGFMKNAFDFIGREKELTLLKTLISSPRPAICVIYGRRRIGKSSLVRKAFEGKDLLSFEGLEKQPMRKQIDNFLFQLSLQTEISTVKHDIKTWREAFYELFRQIEKKPCHVFFDEFQWMANYRSEIVSDLKMVWEQYFSTVPGLTLILCGSIASFMITRVIRSSALYGRTDCQIHLKPFSQSETNRMLSHKGFTERLEAQMFTLGVPKYLELLKDGPSVRMALQKHAFAASGYFVDEFNRIFVSHFGKNPDFRRIIEYLANHAYGKTRKQMALALKIKEGGPLSAHLFDLESAGFISSQTPFNRGADSRLKKYFLTDAYVRFYFAFILPNVNKIDSGMHSELFQRISQTPRFAGWLGRAFEYVCIQHAGRIAQILGFSGIDFIAGPYFNPRDEKIKGVQIDLLFDRADNVITLCEMKYQTQPVGREIIEDVEIKANVLARRFPSKTIQKVLITGSRPTSDLAASGYFYRIFPAEELLDI